MILDVKFRHLDTEVFRLSSSVQVLPLAVAIPRDSYAWNYRELTFSEILAEGGFELLSRVSMRKCHH